MINQDSESTKRNASEELSTTAETSYWERHWSWMRTPKIFSNHPSFSMRESKGPQNANILSNWMPNPHFKLKKKKTNSSVLKELCPGISPNLHINLELSMNSSKIWLDINIKLKLPGIWNSTWYTSCQFHQPFTHLFCSELFCTAFFY